MKSLLVVRIKNVLHRHRYLNTWFLVVGVVWGVGAVLLGTTLRVYSLTLLLVLSLLCIVTEDMIS